MNHISPKELKNKLQDPDIFLLDVREPDEHASFNIGGMLIPLGEIISQAKNIPTDKPVFVYCEKRNQKSDSNTKITGKIRIHKPGKSNRRNAFLEKRNWLISKTKLKK